MDLYNQKWQKFLGRIWPFNFIPFVELVLAAGSLATGNMNENSDFDVIIGVRQGRIFTARFFCWLTFGMFGWRAKHPAYKSNESYKSYRNKICFNHFVTPKAYRLSPPHNEYWKKLYESLIPVYGSPEAIQKFFDANSDWMGSQRIYQDNPRHKYKKSGWIKCFREWLLGGRFGDWAERKLKAIQIKRIERNLKTQIGHKPRIIFNDNELEFHPDTKRIENFLKEE
ncbi:MAG: hypothetical protein HYY86_03515 [Candidatus Harrisonbacteria bacterium]|nr:hypothetical protein [Candidatus Harrisonbacteria bacterium]